MGTECGTGVGFEVIISLLVIPRIHYRIKSAGVHLGDVLAYTTKFCYQTSEIKAEVASVSPPLRKTCKVIAPSL